MGYSEPRIHAKYYQDLFVYQEVPLGFTSGPIAGPHVRAANWNHLGEERKFHLDNAN